MAEGGQHEQQDDEDDGEGGLDRGGVPKGAAAGDLQAEVARLKVELKKSQERAKKWQALHAELHKAAVEAALQ